MRILAIYSPFMNLNFFLELEAMATYYDKIYLKGNDFLEGINMFDDLKNLLFFKSSEEIVEEITDVLFYGNLEDIEEKMQYFIRRGKRVFVYNLSLKNEKKYIHNVSLLMKNKFLHNQSKDELYAIQCPVISIMGISDKCERYKLFLDISLAIEKKGYEVMRLSGEALGQMNKCIQIPNFIYSGKSMMERALFLNHFIYYKVKQRKPDILVIDVPGGIMNQSPTKYMNDGEYAYIISNSVNIDVAVLAIPAHEINNDFIIQILQLCKYRFFSNVVGVAMSCIGSRINIEENKTDYFTVSSDFIKEKYLGRKEQYSVPVLPLHDCREIFAEYILNTLSGEEKFG